MQDSAFKQWLERNYQPNTVNAVYSSVKRIETAYGDIDGHYEKDTLQSLLGELEYSRADERENRPNPTKLNFSTGRLNKALSDMRSALRFYIKFKNAEPNLDLSLDREQLENYREKFLIHCSEFKNLSEESGFYYEQERSFKNKLLKDAAQLLERFSSSPMELGRELYKLIQRQPVVFVRGQDLNSIKKSYAEAFDDVASILGDMVLTEDECSIAISNAAQQLIPIAKHENAQISGAYAYVRSLTTMTMAMVKPNSITVIKTDKFSRALNDLFHVKIFDGLLDIEQCSRFIHACKMIYAELESWGWKPKDLWDVQGFLWVALYEEKDSQSSNHEVAENTGIYKMNEKNAGNLPLNQILYGPPGTGKTFQTAQIAVEICDGEAPQSREATKIRYDELVAAKRIAFTTFHQSIGYEEFVEGLRPVTGSDEDAERHDNAGFRLEPQHGIFRELCTLANAATKQTPTGSDVDLSGRRFFKMSLGNAKTESHIYDAAIEGNYITLGWGGDVDWSEVNPDYSSQGVAKVKERWQQIEPDAGSQNPNIVQPLCFYANMRKGDIVIISDGNLRFRAIAEITGDYEFVPNDSGYNHRRSVRWLRVFDESLPASNIVSVKLSQMSCYELKRNRIKMDALKALLPSQKVESMPQAADNYVLIIDEINRANVSKVLGELITLLEPDKRLGASNEIKLTLPYSSDEFGVPANLYLIGTMNTADRSISQLDTALRRRFEFIEVMPDYEVIDRTVSGIHLGDLLSTMNERIEWLFDREHQIGHSYFCHVENKEQLDSAMANKVIPLIAEYFFDDWEKVVAVLSDTSGLFIKQDRLRAPSVFEGAPEERKRYMPRKPPFNIEAYHQVING